MLRVFEAFAGVGSQRMALRNIGIDFEVVGISDVDRYALLAYDAIHHNGEPVEEKTKEEMLDEFKRCNIAYNFSTGKSELPKRYEDIKKLYEAHVRSKNFGDIRTIDVNELPEIDLFTYSFPCKNISVAGKQDGFEVKSDTQSSLVWECGKIIRAKKPKYLLMENVKNIVGKNHIDNFNKWINVLNDIGYKNYYKVLNACDFNIPQNRERVIMISILDNTDFSFPSGERTNLSVNDILENHDKSFEIDKKLMEFKLDIPTTNMKKLYQVGMLNTKGNQSNRRVYSSFGYCPTLNSMNGGNRQPKILVEVNGDFVIKKLSPLECWRLMGFTDEDFYKAKNAGLSNSKLYERAGRGIVVPMLEEIFKNLFK